ncbi:hypothetical protein MMC18_004029 [Xylographa bjoerkii]|nr:hypothetical protein [Xylographa bjoerkii]
MTESVKIADAVKPNFASSEHVGKIEPYFESAEHESIGDAVLLQYDQGNVYGSKFAYQAGSHILSLGYVVALAGDFYANWDTVSAGCVEQVSDYWTTNEERSIQLFLKIAKTLFSDSGGYLQCIIQTMAAQENDVRNGIGQGEDPAQDAVHAYSAGHTAALRQAKIANQTRSYSDLKQAYFLEGFALHYLTDLFSTGHMREARRILHKTYLGAPEQPEQPDIEVYPADLCAQKQHDEDSANGLWVQNQLGESWPAYGDKQLFTGKSAKNFQQAVNAAQSGVLEIWNTYKSGIIPPTENFEALKRIPILDNLNQPPNFFPLFQWNKANPNSLLWRKDMPRRNDPDLTALSASMSITQWNGIISQIKASPQDINMYPFSQSFNSGANTIHFRLLSQSEIAINLYGPLNPGPVWNMQGQSVTQIPEVPGITTWISTTKLGINNLGAGVYSLVGFTASPNKGPITVTHLGFSISDSASDIELIWSDDSEDGNDFWTLIDTNYGTYSRDNSDIAMIKYWKNGPRGANKFELYSIPADFSAGPTRVNLNWPTALINAMFSYRIQLSDPSDFLVSVAVDSTQKRTTWNFTSWSNGYSKINTETFLTSTAFPVQTILTGKVGSDSQNASIVQLYYGNTFPVPNYVLIEVVQPSRTTSGRLALPSPRSSQQFPIAWPAHQSSEYLNWFLSDVNGDGITDLVAYASSDSNTTLTVVVFPGQASSDFSAPISSSITLPANRGALFTANFMFPVHARQAAYTYPATDSNIGTDNGPTSNAGILSFFDNYGILGVRMVAPVTATGTFTYEFKGQTPAIAGQLSTGLGWRAQNLMGRGESSEAIGFVSCC